MGIYKVNETVSLRSRYSYYNHAKEVLTVVSCDEGWQNTYRLRDQHGNMYRHDEYMLKRVKKPKPIFELQIDYSTKNIDEAIEKASAIAKAIGHPVRIAA